MIFYAKFQTRYGHTLFKIMPLVFVQRAKTLGEFQRSANTEHSSLSLK